jgi:hypothetical protein
MHRWGAGATETAFRALQYRKSDRPVVLLTFLSQHVLERICMVLSPRKHLARPRDGLFSSRVMLCAVYDRNAAEQAHPLHDRCSQQTAHMRLQQPA